MPPDTDFGGDTNIVISGLTAAGKTTHARRLAKQLGYDYVSASQYLAEAAGIAVEGPGHWWMSKGDQVAAARRRARIDEKVDRMLTTLARDGKQTIFDAWALPWISDAPMVCIWLQSDFPSRCRKCLISHLNEGISYTDCTTTIEEKDAESRQIFQALHGFDLFLDHEDFDIILDLSELIPQPTRACSESSIARAHRYLSVAIEVCRHGSPDGLSTAIAGLPPGAVVRGPGI
jgi:cytidylate kinase